jgi:hypothetical protein
MRRLVTIIALTLCFSTVGLALATTTALGPEVDSATGSFSVTPKAPPTSTTCVGEDAVNYRTDRGTWSGTITDTSPVPLDVSIGGKVTIAATITVNLTTARGLLTGRVTLKSGGIKTMTGTITGVTQVLNANLDVGLRGWVVGTMFTAAGASGDFFLANVEATVSGTTGAITGQIGGAPVQPDLSIETTKLSC